MDPSKCLIRNFIINPQSIDKNLLCLICQQFVIDPKECQSCQTLFCSQCIDDWLLKQANNFQLQYEVTCPNSCKSIKLNQPHKMFRYAIQQIIVNCGYYGCQQQMKIEDWDNHRKNCKNLFSFSQQTAQSMQNSQSRINICNKCNTQFCDVTHDCIKTLNERIQELQKRFQQYQEKTTKNINDLLERIVKQEKQQKLLIEPQCDQLHILKWIYPQNGPICSSCKLSTTTARYICEQCRIYYCQKCRKPQFKEGFCPVNHPLQFNLQALQYVHCDYCYENIFSKGESVYSDRFCDLDICNSCYQSLQKNYK